MKTLYTASATASGRDGRAASDDGVLDLPLAAPKAAGGSGEGTNPEQLFAAGYAACFASALQVVARRLKLDVEGEAVTAEVDLRAMDDRSFGIAVRLRVALPDTIEAAAAEDLVARAHAVCPYSNATRDNIPVELVVERAAQEAAPAA